MPSSFSIAAPAHRFRYLLPAILALACLAACQQASAPGAAPNGGGAPTTSASSPPPAPPTVVQPAAPKPEGVPKNGAKPPMTSARPPATGAEAAPAADGVHGAIPRFSWPPPKASAQQAIPDKWLRTGRAPTLADVADKFEKAMQFAGYAQRSYYEVPRGFALATQLEHIRRDGTPLLGEDRWKVGPPRVGNLTLLAFIEALAHAPAGIYRAIVFVVTDASWTQSPIPPGEKEIEAWAGGGAASLPAYIGSLPYGGGYRAHALIYEFRKGASGPAESVLPSEISGEDHLDRGGIWDPLSIL